MQQNTACQAYNAIGCAIVKGTKVRPQYPSATTPCNDARPLNCHCPHVSPCVSLCVAWRTKFLKYKGTKVFKQEYKSTRIQQCQRREKSRINYSSSKLPLSPCVSTCVSLCVAWNKCRRTKILFGKKLRMKEYKKNNIRWSRVRGLFVDNTQPTCVFVCALCLYCNKCHDAFEEGWSGWHATWTLLKPKRRLV